MSDCAYRGPVEFGEPWEVVVRIRPEAEQKLRAGFQRRVDRQAERYVAPLTHAEQLAARLECGEVVAVFSGQAGGVPLREATSFITGAWFGRTAWRRRESRRRGWFYAFAQGCALLDGSRTDAVCVRWSEIAEVDEVWTKVSDVSAEESRPTLTAYTLRCADGRTCEISRSLRNVRDPYPGAGPLLTGLMPAAAGAIMPKFPTIDEVIATFAGKPDPRA
jgi:hypothetical protein